MTVNTGLESKLEQSALKQTGKSLKKQKLRNNEYYDLQPTFDELHRKATSNHVFTNLLPIIASEDNILLAYRNIKKNDGSKTHGTDGLTIEHYKKWTEERFVKYFQNKLKNYHPKSVRRVEIPKSWKPGKTRPLGIPCMDDRIIQQCIKQVLEPICEAHFHNHSYGFRPNRGTNHATPAIVNDLVEKIVVHQAQGVGKSKTQQLDIYYNFVGVLEMPDVVAVPNSIMIDTRQGVAVEYITRKAG